MFTARDTNMSGKGLRIQRN